MELEGAARIASRLLGVEKSDANAANPPKKTSLSPKRCNLQLEESNSLPFAAV